MTNTNLLDWIIKEIEERLDSVDVNPERVNSWQVIYLWDWIAKVVGLRDISYNELVEFESGATWVALNLEENFVWVVILSGFSTIKEWMIAKKTWKVLEVPVGEWLLWRVVDALWNPIDWLGEIKSSEYYPTERVATWVMSRKSVHEPLETWIKAIDSLVPIWRWQRELIIGDRQTWKTQIAIDTILNQKGKGIKCIYVSIWQKDSKVVAISEELKKAWAMDYTIIVSAWSSAPASMQWLSPFSGTAMAEYFMFKWEHALIIFDDLTKHANAYREMSLLLRRPPGREAYPWDVFYLHSRLLERAAKLNDSLGAWSLTALPIIETQAWDVSAYIPTNVISITDWQIFLETWLFNAWIKPAINVWLSVSRVWGSAQTKAMKKVAWTLKLSLAQFRELEAFSQFASDLDEDTRKELERWKRMVEILKQWIYSPISFDKQVCLIYAWTNGYLDSVEVSKLHEFEKDLYTKLDKEKSILESIVKEKAMNDDSTERLKNILVELKEMY
ncbi:MAG: hypothetical protein ACD_4C00356G0002 [uncultured bacterium (gcode 4)]|uniref:ATP synthase subunit alpha n=1 Tax=uncultured bacterium (gcode 4) TaxID=1234023 RepID=K2F586_9BACT|nr:MAG: hypothetical protein ACD_4C00356G0002 [uncultured bacterium (gcode 4)]